MTILNLGNRKITRDSEPYIIAEIGVNHEGSLEKAKELIVLAKTGGADAVKFQSYKADNLASKNSPAYWDIKKEPTKNQHELFKKYDSFEPNDYFKLSEFSKKNDIEFMSTPFDDKAIEFLNPLVSCFKIASADITNVPLLRNIAKKNKPVFLSTGASTLGEIDFAINELVKSGCKKKEIVLLHCILNYPTKKTDANLNMIKGLIKKYPEQLIGYSDHTLPDKNMSTLFAAYLLGAVIIEKHFTDNKMLKGNDHYHAMDIEDLKNFKKIIKETENLMGTKIDKDLIGTKIDKEPIESEQIARKNARRSIVLKHNVKAGQKLLETDIICKRPGSGLSPIDFDNVIGCTTLKDLEEDHILKWEDLIRK